MAKNISTGIEKTLEVLKTRQSDELNASWRDLRNKLDSMLVSSNVMKTNDTMRACRVLDTMSTAERRQHILGNWGPQYANSAGHLLIQLEQLEKRIAMIKDQSDI